MDILPNEVESIKNIGSLYGDDVKIIKTIGGFYLAVGKKKRASKSAEALAGGSHPALVAHQISKEYGVDFEPAMCKSEADQLEVVEDKTHLLTKSDIATGIKLYSLSKSNKFDFILYKNGITLSHYVAQKNGKDFVVNKLDNGSDLVTATKEKAEAISRAIREKAFEMNATKVKLVK